MLKWRIYYDDETTFDNTQGAPKAAPSFGVIAIPQPDPEVGRVVMHKWDWYYWRLDWKQWWGSDLQGLLDNLLHNMPITAIKQGRNVHNTVFRDIWARVIADPDFPIKSGQRIGEQP